MRVQCRCRGIEIEVSAEPIAQFYCHCDDGQAAWRRLRSRVRVPRRRGDSHLRWPIRGRLTRGYINRTPVSGRLTIRSRRSYFGIDCSKADLDAMEPPMGICMIDERSAFDHSSCVAQQDRQEGASA